MAVERICNSGEVEAEQEIREDIEDDEEKCNVEDEGSEDEGEWKPPHDEYDSNYDSDGSGNDNDDEFIMILDQKEWRYIQRAVQLLLDRKKRLLLKDPELDFSLPLRLASKKRYDKEGDKAAVLYMSMSH